MSASVCSLWPTARASSGTGADSSDRDGGPTLQTRAALWPSPRANDSEKRGGVDATDQRNGLVGAAALWPTPSAALTNDDEGPETFRARQAAQKARGINGNGAGLPLTVAAKEWRTPSAGDEKAGPAESQNQVMLAHQAVQWGTPSTMDARGRTYTRDGGEKGKERLALTGPASAVAEWATEAPTTPESLSFQSIHLVRANEAVGAPSSSTSPSLLRLAPEFTEWLMGWPPGWTIPSPGSMRREPTASAPPATAWSHWQQRQRTWLSRLSSSDAPPPEAEPEMRQMELI